MRETLTGNLSLKFLSLIAALLIWLVVVNVDDPVRTETYSAIRVNMVNEEAITSKGKVYKIEDNSDWISVQVSAKRSVHKKLSSADFVATADMEKDIQFDNLVAINVTCSNRNVKTTDIKQSRNNVKVSIENSATEEFNVVVKQRGTEGAGYLVGEMIPEQRVISVTGPESLVGRIRRLETEIDVTGRTTDDTVISRLKVVDGNGDSVDTTYLSFNGKETGIAVKIQMLNTKEAKLKLSVSGTPGRGYRYTDLTYKPETVMIAGRRGDLEELDVLRIPREAINIEGLRESTVVEVPLTEYLPENIRLVDEEGDGIVTATVTLEAEQIREMHVPVTNINVIGVPDGHQVYFGELEEVVIPVSALKEELDELNSDDIVVKLNVSALEEEGVYSLPLQIYIAGVYEVYSKVEVTFDLVWVEDDNPGQENEPEADRKPEKESVDLKETEEKTTEEKTTEEDSGKDDKKQDTTSGTA